MVKPDWLPSHMRLENHHILPRPPQLSHLPTKPARAGPASRLELGEEQMHLQLPRGTKDDFTKQRGNQ